MSMHGATALAKMDGMFTTDYRILLLILPTIENGDSVWVNQQGLAKELGVARQQVNRSIRKLISKGIIERLTSIDGHQYRLNSSFAWYGGDNEKHWSSLKTLTKTIQ